MTGQPGEEIQKQSVDLGFATSRQTDVFLFITLEELIKSHCPALLTGLHAQSSSLPIGWHMGQPSSYLVSLVTSPILRLSGDPTSLSPLVA